MNITTDTIVCDAEESEYSVLKYIGRGSFSDVYKIENLAKKKIFALKIVQMPFLDHNTIKAITNEGILAMNISHNNVIKYHYFHDGERYDNLPLYVIMDYADGGTLLNIIFERKKKKDFFDNEKLNSFYTQLIDGMEAINEVLIHRDIKPDNILISDKTLKISDFGLSKIVDEGTRNTTFKGFGHIQYLAPEGWNYENNTLQMDIYSMGMVFYELATLQHPLNLNSIDTEKWRNAHLFQNIADVRSINSDITLAMSQLIMKMIEKKTSERFTTWDDIREFFSKDNIVKSINSTLVNEIVSKRLDKDAEIKKEQLKN